MIIIEINHRSGEREKQKYMFRFVDIARVNTLRPHKYALVEICFKNAYYMLLVIPL